MRPLTRDEVRQIDRRASDEFGVPSIVLMENAGRGAAELLIRLGAHAPVVIVCGKGNNGGDGFVMARHLELAGIRVMCLLSCKFGELSGDAAINGEIVAKSGIEIVERASPDVLSDRARAADWVVDALLGTGARGEPMPPLDGLIDAINASNRPILAIDLPSGLDCDTGEPARHTVRAAHTATFVAPKVGFAHQSAVPYLGAVHVVDIGAPRRLVEEYLADQRES